MQYTSPEVYEFISKQTNDPILEWRTCRVSWKEFAIFQSDIDYLKKLSPVFNGKKYEIPLPTLCPEERQRQQLLFKNERNLYQSTCDLSGKKIISRINPEIDIPVYSNEARASDDRDCLDYWIDRDENTDFFSTLEKLAWSLPYQDLIGSFSNTQNNSSYTNYTADIVDSYLVFDWNTVENCAYVSKVKWIKQVFDCYGVVNCENCYECIDCMGMYQSFFCQDCSWCRESAYLFNCIGCECCIGCVNLVQKSYHIFNKPVSKNEFNDFKNELKQNWRRLSWEKINELIRGMIKPATNMLRTENCIWENIKESANVVLSKNIVHSQDMRYCSDMEYSQDCWWVDAFWHDSSLLYSSVQVWRYSTKLWCCATIWKWENLLYCIDTKKSKNCFWCVNVKGWEYYIFNKKYSPEEYEKIVWKIMDQLVEKWIWWSFIPISCSIFPYNDSGAMDEFPVDKENIKILDPSKSISDAILDLWWEEKLKIKRRTKKQEINIPDWIEILNTQNLPKNISDISDDILQKAIICEVSWRPFRIVKTELNFYRKNNLPIPTKHPDIRNKERVDKRPWKVLHLRMCDKCWIEMLSVYDKDSEYKVYCEKCYQKEIYG